MRITSLWVSVVTTLAFFVVVRAAVKPERPAAWHPRASDLRLAASQTLPETESAQQVVFSETVSGIPSPGGGVDRVTAPPWAVIVNQRLRVKEVSTGTTYEDGQVTGGLRLVTGPEFTWAPGTGTTIVSTDRFHLLVTMVALNQPQGFILKLELTNTTSTRHVYEIASLQAPSLVRPARWNYASAFRRGRLTPLVSTEGFIAAHAIDSVGAVAAGIPEAVLHSVAGASESQIVRTVAVESGAQDVIFCGVVFAADAALATSALQGLLARPDQALADARRAIDTRLEEFARHIPAFSHSDSRIVRFYRQAALQLLYDRWRLSKVLFTDPWYPTGGRDSGAMDAYAWDLGYSSMAMSIADPHALRRLIVAMPRAPLTKHYSIEPITGTGNGPFYSYSPYAYTCAVDQYLRATGDFTVLSEAVNGKTVLAWLQELAEWGERERDPDGNGLLDFGDDHNLLELKKTGNGPGYVHEVPSPNGERVYVYQAIARWLEKASAERYHERAARVREALNRVLWLEREGWYGSRQADGTVVPVYSIQIFDLLRVPGLIPENRARRLLAHLNNDEFLGPWGVRSMSARDRLFDYRDHDWAGPMSYIGDAPQLVADLLDRGFVKEGRAALDRILWWPEHLSVLPQGIANDDYSTHVPASKPFGGRISAGRTSMISGVVGVEAIVRGIFGIQRGTDGSIRFRPRRLPTDGPASIEFPFRGNTWLVTHRREGLFAGMMGGIEASVDTPDASLEFSIQRDRVRILVSATSKATLDVPVSPLLRHFQVTNAGALAVRWNQAARKPAQWLRLEANRCSVKPCELLIVAARR